MRKKVRRSFAVFSAKLKTRMEGGVKELKRRRINHQNGGPALPAECKGIGIDSSVAGGPVSATAQSISGDFRKVFADMHLCSDFFTRPLAAFFLWRVSPSLVLLIA